jgi:hypothetical protein
MRVACVAPFIAALTLQAAAEEEVDLARELAASFIGGCVQTLPNTERIIRLAETMNYEPLPPDIASMLAPSDESATWSGWLVDQYPAPPHFLFVSEGETPAGTLKICGVANPYAPADEVVEKVLLMLELSAPQSDQNMRGQRERVWTVGEGEFETMITIVDATPMDDPGLTMSAAAFAFD